MMCETCGNDIPHEDEVEIFMIIRIGGSFYREDSFHFCSETCTQDYFLTQKLDDMK